MIDSRTFAEITEALAQPVYVENKDDGEAVGMALYKALRERVPAGRHHGAGNQRETFWRGSDS